MKTVCSRILAAAALLAFSAPLPALSQMKDMPIREHREHGQMMEMGTMDRMGDMMGMCINMLTRWDSPMTRWRK
jgi:hypothetical protein